MPGSRTQKQASSHPSRRESSRTSLPCALLSRTLGQTARSKGRLRNSNLSNDKCKGARKLTFSKHDCSVQHDPRRRHQTCVRVPLGCRSPIKNPKRGPFCTPKLTQYNVAPRQTREGERKKLRKKFRRPQIA